jgi:hypothetical protein
MADFVLDRRNTLARCLLLALARRERAGRTAPRLLEAGRATWVEFKGNLEHQHLLALLAEDAAVRFPLPADLDRVIGSRVAHGFGHIPDVMVREWLMALKPEPVDAARQEALSGYARSLDLPTRFAGADLHKIQADKRVLELPGTGGQLVARALERSPDAYLHTNCTVLTASWAERAMAGLVAMEWDAPGVDFVVEDAELGWATDPEQRNRFDLVFGLLPEKGGRWDLGTLMSRFPAATVVLV